MVPPNLTGDLHLGHALMLAIQDCLVRHARATGAQVTYVPGFDHAGIGLYASVVQARDFRPDLPMDARLLRWAESCRDRQRRQMQDFDVTCDWDRELYTLDPGHREVVRKAFDRLAAEGLVHRDFRVVGWCPACATTISDMEASPVQTEIPVVEVPVLTERGELTAALDRPELFWGVTAVVHGRRRVGEGTCRLPGGREVPLLYDQRLEDVVHLCVPAHDRDAFALARARAIDVVEVLDAQARSLQVEARGLSREELRDWTVDRLELPAVPRPVTTETCGRCRAELVQRPTWQWFVRMGPLAEPVLDAIRGGEVRLEPSSTAREAIEWLTGSEDWCVSRQIPWGHRIPASRCPTCAAWAPEGRETHCGGCGSRLVPETDVLDTWFSSSLWFLTTAGWPERVDPAVYPYSIVTTGRDILFFWVLRSLALCRHLGGSMPTTLCYLHGLVLDAQGRKMSKSLGNVVDLQQACARHGPDVVRAALLAGCHEGQDIKLTDALLQRQRRVREVAAGAASLGVRAGPGGDCLDHWMAQQVRLAAEQSSAALHGRQFAAALQALAALAEGPLSRYVGVRRSQAAAGEKAGVPAWLLAQLGALLEPAMPRVAATLAGAAGAGPGPPDPPDGDRAAAAACWMAALREATQLRGPVGLSTAIGLFVGLPAAPAALLAAEPWVRRSGPLRLRLAAAPADFVEWRFPLGEDEASLHLPPEHAARLRREAVRRLRAERERLRELRRRAPTGRPAPAALAEQIAQRERLVRLLAANADRAGVMAPNTSA